MKSRKKNCHRIKSLKKYFYRMKKFVLRRECLKSQILCHICMECNVSWRNARQYHHEEGQKKICAAARSFWPEARFWDFFGLKKAEGLLKAKKIPKTGRRPKWPCQSTKLFFVIPNDEKCRALTHELHFSTLSKFFPLQKVNFPELKIPLGFKGRKRGY